MDKDINYTHVTGEWFGIGIKFGLGFGLGFIFIVEVGAFIYTIGGAIAKYLI